MKKYLLIIFLIIGISITNNVYATSGRISASNIVSCNGIYYGHHGNGHWHVAEKRSDGYWYAQGDSIYTSNPCGTVTPPTTTVTTTNRQTTTTKRITTITTKEKITITTTILISPSTSKVTTSVSPTTPTKPTTTEKIRETNVESEENTLADIILTFSYLVCMVSAIPAIKIMLG